MKTILVLDDEAIFLELAQESLEKAGYKVIAVMKGADAVEKLKNTAIDLCLFDMKLPDVNGIDLLKEVRPLYPDIPVLMFTAFASVETAVEAMKMGATDYLSKPFNPEELILKVRKALEQKQLTQMNRYLLGALKEERGCGALVGQSAVMKEIYGLIEQMAKAESTVLILGESGTGKELVANAIHSLSPRKDKPFVKANCSAFSEGILESELFGHEKGAFTGAVERQLGRFEVADSGTLFLDEIGDLPLPVQVKFLRVLEEKSFERVGSSKPINVDVRILAATNRDLTQLVKEGKFRDDLFYRLNVLSLFLPPLRKRKEDIGILVESFIKKYSRELKKNIQNLEPHFLECLNQYDWPGNVRELENAVERAIVLAKTEMLRIQDLPIDVKQKEVSRDEKTEPLLQVKEKETIVKVLQEEMGNKQKAAEKLGMGRTTLWRKLRKYRIDEKKAA